MDKPPVVPPAVVAQMDQVFAEADQKYGELADYMRQLTVDHDSIGAMLIMGSSLQVAPKSTLIDIIITGLRREVNRKEDLPDDDN